MTRLPHPFLAACTAAGMLGVALVTAGPAAADVDGERRYISTTGGGDGDGSSWADAGTWHDLPDFIEAMDRWLEAHVGPDAYIPSQAYDAEIGLDAVTPDLIAALEASLAKAKGSSPLVARRRRRR